MATYLIRKRASPYSEGCRCAGLYEEGSHSLFTFLSPFFPDFSQEENIQVSGLGLEFQVRAVVLRCGVLSLGGHLAMSGTLPNTFQCTGQQPTTEGSSPKCQLCLETVSERRTIKAKRQRKVSTVYPFEAAVDLQSMHFPLSAMRWPLASQINENSTRLERSLRPAGKGTYEWMPR